MKLAVSNSNVPIDPFAGLDYMLPDERERVFAAAGIDFKAGDSLEKYMAAKCALGEMRRRARMVEELMEITEAKTEQEALETIQTWVKNKELIDQKR